MMRKHWLTYNFALSAALLPWQGHSLHAQSLNYSVSVSPLPARVGQSLTVTVPVPATVPDGTSFSLSAGIVPYDPASNYSTSGTSLNHVLTVQIPALTTPGPYKITVYQYPHTIGAFSALGIGQINLLVSAPDQTLNPVATFTGQYSFLFQGQVNNTPGVANGVVAAGTLAADGKGNITAGVMDLNSAVGVAGQNISVTGTYQLDGIGKGVMLLTTPEGLLGFNFFVPPAQPGVIVNNAGIVPFGGLTGSGQISRTGDFFNVNYFDDPHGYPIYVPLVASVGFSEETNSATGFTPGISLLSFTQDLKVTGVGQALAGSPSVFTGAAGTYSNSNPPQGSNPGANRFTMTLSAPGQLSTTPTHYAGYEGTEASGVNVLYLLSLDPYPAASLVVGKAVE